MEEQSRTEKDTAHHIISKRTVTQPYITKHNMITPRNRVKQQLNTNSASTKQRSA